MRDSDDGGACLINFFGIVCPVTGISQVLYRVWTITNVCSIFHHGNSFLHRAHVSTVFYTEDLQICKHIKGYCTAQVCIRSIQFHISRFCTNYNLAGVFGFCTLLLESLDVEMD